jgi:4-amino-4-deoxy-L-arabinose transferase-like glycosyltransferase
MPASRDALPTLFAALLLGLFASWYAPMIGTGFISHTDEYATLDRSSSMLTTGDWGTVHSRNLPSFKKPPLQYWMSAALMEAGVGLPTALRLPSLLFALAGLAATGFLARVVLPDNPWAAPAAIFLCATSAEFWAAGTSALLDSGSLFLATLAVAATVRALERPGWWYVVAVAVVLGALQKAPIGLFLVLGYLLVLSRTIATHGIDVHAIRRSPPFRRAVWIAVIGSLAWPALQVLRHSTVTVVEDLLGQTVGRFIPAGLDEDLADFTGLYGMILGDEPVLRGLGIAALLWLPWRLRRFDLLPLPVLFGAFVLLMYLAVGNVSGRYTVVFLPWLAVALAAVVLSLPGPALLRGAAILGVSALALGPLRPASELRLDQPPEQAAAIAALRDVGAALRPDETLVICNWRPRLFPPGAVTYFAADGRPFEMPLAPDEVGARAADGTLAGPFRGLCPTAQLDEIAGSLAGLVRVTERDGFTHWTATGAAPP